MTIATYITLFRIFLLPLQVYLTYFYPWAAVILFVILSLSDWLDGYIARKFDMVSTMGKFLDPLADKVLVTAMLIIFLQKGDIDGVSLILLISREFIVQGIRMAALEQGVKNVGASWTAKFKTVFLMLAILFMLMKVSVIAIPLYYAGIVLALVSMVEYMYKNRRIFE